MSKGRKRLAPELRPPLRQYRRSANPNIDPNDRRYDREVEAQVRRLGAEEFQALWASGAEAEVAAAHEVGLAAFLRPERRDRFRHLLRSEGGRAKLRASLAHFRDLDPAACTAVPGQEQTPRGIETLLARAGAPAVCYVVSEDEALDGTVLPLHEALTAVIGRRMGALISCIPGRLGYYEGEGPRDRVVLRRDGV